MPKDDSSLNGSDKKQTDVSELSKLDVKTLGVLLEYSYKALERAQGRLDVISSKASQGMGFVAVAGAVLVFAMPTQPVTNPALIPILIGGVGSLLASAICSLVCLQVRLFLEPATVSKSVQWFYEERENLCSPRLIAGLITDIANAEIDHNRKGDTKARFLAAAQLLQVAGVGFLFLYFLLSILLLQGEIK